MNFGKRLKNALTRKKIPNSQLAKMINVKAYSITDWITERSSPSPDLIQKIANALNVSPVELIGDASNISNFPDSGDVGKCRQFDEEALREVAITVLGIIEVTKDKKSPEVVAELIIANYLLWMKSKNKSVSERKNAILRLVGSG